MVYLMRRIVSCLSIKAEDTTWFIGFDQVVSRQDKQGSIIFKGY